MNKTTKLEEALLKLHLDIDGDREEALDTALQTIRQLTSLIIGQQEIEDHDVSLQVQVLVRERNKLRKEQLSNADKYMGKSLGTKDIKLHSSEEKI